MPPVHQEAAEKEPFGSESALTLGPRDYLTISNRWKALVLTKQLGHVSRASHQLTERARLICLLLASI